ncbi:hypothetical protein GCM10023114_28650 [Mycolicibacterium sediminis]|uniref:Uncharacterized protein n=1 Tax=Mycolicibacterium sediminis TaxID=1286180 RepID=A0A7I7QX17_9MYCO|nr:hypothetical protein MSEDJ_49480 [Mycolicibacterium sediminis]
MLARELCRLDTPPERAADTGHLVGRDLLTVARAADDDAEAAGVRDRPRGGGDAERRVVVLGVVGEGAAVDGVVAAGPEVLDDCLLEFESGVVGTEVDAHGRHDTWPLTGACGTAGAYRTPAAITVR